MTYHDASNEISTRINGTSSVGPAAAFIVGQNLVAEFHSSTGFYDKNGNRVYTNSAFAALTYPNSVPLLLGCNAANGENMNGRFYQVIGFASEPSAANAQLARAVVAVKSGILISGNISFQYLVDANGTYLVDSTGAFLWN